MPPTSFLDLLQRPYSYVVHHFYNDTLLRFLLILLLFLFYSSFCYLTMSQNPCQPLNQHLTWTYNMVEYPMFKNERDNMNNDKKIEIIKSLLLIDTAKWLEKIRTVVDDSICAESEQDTKDREDYKKWKEDKQQPELPF